MVYFSIGTFIMMLEILLGIAAFVFACPRRKWFWIRLPLAIGIALTAAYFFPLTNELAHNSAYSFLRIIYVLSLAFGAVLFCFDIKPFVALVFVSSGYALQHIGYQFYSIANSLTLSSIVRQFFSQNRHLTEYLFCFTATVLGFLILGIRSAKMKFYQRYDWRMSVIAVITIFICCGASRLIRLIPNVRTGGVESAFFSMLCCILALIIQFTMWDLANVKVSNIVTTQRLLQEQKQYAENKEFMETLNVRIHDIKHLLKDYEGELPKEYIDSFRKEFDFYDNRFVSNNPSLDALLTRFVYSNMHKGVTIKFIGDSALLDFMDELDLIVLFDNAVGNAIEAVLKLDRSKRTITILVDKKGNLASIVFLNYFDGQLKLEGNLPVSKKKEGAFFEHGFGMKSIRNVAKKYGGEMSFFTANGAFHLNVYLFDPRNQ